MPCACASFLCLTGFDVLTFVLRNSVLVLGSYTNFSCHSLVKIIVKGWKTIMKLRCCFSIILNYFLIELYKRGEDGRNEEQTKGSNQENQQRQENQSKEYIC